MKHLLKAGAWVEGGEGLLDSRTVLRLDTGNKGTPFVVHTECREDNGASSFMRGDYCTDLEDGLKAFAEREAE